MSNEGDVGPDAPEPDKSAREYFEEANERIKARSGRDLIGAILIAIMIGAALLLSLVIWKPAFVLFALAAAVFATGELSGALRGGGYRVDAAPAIGGGVVIVLGGWFLSAWQLWGVVVGVLVVVVVWRLVAQMIAADRRDARSVAADLVAAVFVQLYVSVMAALCVGLLRQDDGQWWVLAFVIVAVACDTGAYAAGITWGKHPMAPRISPKKTWEGFGGAVAAALIAGVLLALFMLHLPWWWGLVFGVVILVTATVGDLGESLVKRDLGIKDMSSLLPGHGGVLDRLDSILPSAGAALALYLLLTPWVGAL